MELAEANDQLMEEDPEIFDGPLLPYNDPMTETQDSPLTSGQRVSPYKDTNQDTPESPSDRLDINNLQINVTR